MHVERMVTLSGNSTQGTLHSISFKMKSSHQDLRGKKKNHPEMLGNHFGEKEVEIIKMIYFGTLGQMH